MRSSFAGVSLAHLSWVLNAYNILFAATLVPAGRLADRVRPAALLPRRHRPLPRRVDGLRARPERRRAHRRACRAGGRAARSSFPRRSASCCPSSRSSGARRRPPCGARPAPSLPRPARASAACSSTGRAGGRLLRQPLHRAAGAHPGAAPAAREPGRAPRRSPIPLGARLLVVAVGALSLAIVEGPSWGWRSSGRIIAAFRARRCSLRSSSRGRRATARPSFELALFRVRSFAVANAGVFVFSLGLLRVAALQRAVPHRRLALLRPACRRRAHARPVDGGALRADRRPAVGPVRPARRRRSRRPVLRRRRALLPARHRHGPCVRLALPAGDVAHRHRRRSVVRRHLERRRRRAPARAIRHRQRHLVHLAPDRRRRRHRRAHRHSRCAPQRQPARPPSTAPG